MDKVLESTFNNKHIDDIYQSKSKYQHSKSHRWHPDKRESEY